MIHLNCPTCGRRGSLPDSKVQTRLHCPKCDAVFHVTYKGQVVLGEPGGNHKPKLGDPDKPLGEAPAHETGDAVEMVERMPLPLLVGLGLFLIWVGFWAARALGLMG